MPISKSSERPKLVEDLLIKARKFRRVGEYSPAEALLEQAYTLVNPDDYVMIGNLYVFDAQLCRDKLFMQEALSLYLMSVDVFERTGNVSKIAHSLRHVADIQLELGLLQEADRHYRQTIELYQSRADTLPIDLANALRGYACLAEATDDKDAAKSRWKEALEKYMEAGILDGIEECSTKLVALNA